MASGFIQSLREHIRARNYSKRTEQTYVYWAVQFILGERHIVQFLEYLVVKRNVRAQAVRNVYQWVLFRG